MKIYLITTLDHNVLEVTTDEALALKLANDTWIIEEWESEAPMSPVFKFNGGVQK